MSDKWHTKKCDKCHRSIGLTNDSDLIFGGILIRQPRTNLLCNNCGKINVFRNSLSDAKIIRFLTEKEIAEITSGSGLDAAKM